MFRLSIVTPEQVVLEADVASLVVPGTEGYLGVLSNHAPLITALKPGEITYNDTENRVNYLAVSGGFLEVSGNVATLLADAVEVVEQIDLERARESHKRAWEMLKAAGQGDEGIDLARARAAMKRAANRIKLAQSSHS